MKKTLQPGIRLTRRVVVDEGRTIAFMGDEARVYATPAMVSDIEYACRDLIVAHCDENEDSVGIKIEVEHLAATPLGYPVKIEVTLDAIDGRQASLSAEVHDGVERVGHGRHTRFIVDTAKTVERLGRKRQQLDAL